MFARRTLFGLGVVGVLAASPLRADFKDFSNYCSPGAMRACASLQIFTTLNGSGGTDVMIRVQSLQGWGVYGDNTGGSAITRIGIVAPVNIGSATNLSIATTAGAIEANNASSLWGLRTPGSIGSPIELTAGISSGVSGAILGCGTPYTGMPSIYFRTCGGGWIEFSFTTSNAWSADDAELAWVIDRTANFNSDGLECDTDTIPAPGRTGCLQASPVPEPITMVLLGSGLAGMGGVGFLRRRRKDDDIAAE